MPSTLLSANMICSCRTDVEYNTITIFFQIWIHVSVLNSFHKFPNCMQIYVWKLLLFACLLTVSVCSWIHARSTKSWWPHVDLYCCWMEVNKTQKSAKPCFLPGKRSVSCDHQTRISLHVLPTSFRSHTIKCLCATVRPCEQREYTTNHQRVAKSTFCAGHASSFFLDDFGFGNFKTNLSFYFTW